MGTKNNPGTFDCYEAADPDEPMFVLLGRDPHAPILVEAWAKWRRESADMLSDRAEADRMRAKADEASACAQSMRDWPARVVS